MKNEVLDLWIDWQKDNEINEKRFSDFFVETLTSRVVGEDPYESVNLIFAFLKMKEAFLRWLKEEHPDQGAVITHVEQDWRSTNFMELWNPTFLQQMEAEARKHFKIN